MKRKPDTCKGCPLYKDGEGFVPDHISHNAPVLTIAMWPSTFEYRTGQPQSGSVTEGYRDKYEKYAGPMPKSYAHVIRCRGQKGTPLPKGKTLKDGAAFCRQYDVIPEAAELIVYNGIQVGKIMRPDIGVTKVLKWRGFTYPPRPKENTE